MMRSVLTCERNGRRNTRATAKQLLALSRDQKQEELQAMKVVGALVRRVGNMWENGLDTYQISKILYEPEDVVYHRLHHYLHWRRSDHPALEEATLTTGEDYDASSYDENQIPE